MVLFYAICKPSKGVVVDQYAYFQKLYRQIPMIKTINPRNNRSTVAVRSNLLALRPTMPPNIPPRTISAKAPQWNSGMLPLKSVMVRLVNWLNRMIYKLFAAAVLVLILKK